MVAPTAGVDTAAAPAAAIAGQLPQNVSDWIRVGLAYLKEKARRFRDPGIYVDTILDNDDEPQWAAIVGAIREGATFENLLQFDPEIGQEGMRSWFQRLYDGVHSELFQAVDSTRAGGNENNTTDHARTRATGQ
jgi:hypothetical protein